jgi:hypothetical protein
MGLFSGVNFMGTTRAKNNRKSGLIAFAVMVLLGAGTGCRDVTSQTVADAATQELGLPVFLWAFNEDECAFRQLTSLYNEYKSWNRAGENSLAERFRSTYSAVVFLKTRELGEITGELKTFQLWNDRRYVINERRILDTRRTASGQRPGTIVHKGNPDALEGRVLTVEPVMAVDHSEKTIYYTYNQYVFRDMLRADHYFDWAIDTGVARESGTRYSDADPCGRLVTLSDLF